MTDPRYPDGWAFIGGSRKAHYQQNGRTLCGNYGMYHGPVEPDDKPSPDDCASCRRKRDAQVAKAVNATAGNVDV